ncbi:MAG: ATP-dependent helicase HrpB [Desulfobulbaceae bacterium]|nr:ATP-dependent helicase HrpB [Desulfobulbaceae bacterium]
MTSDLPINDVLPELGAALSQHPVVVLTAPPGSGKTTGVPLALLQEKWLQDKNIIMLEPRRLAARAAAGRMAKTLGETVGQTVGYQIRFEKKISSSTRIEVLTEGILTRRIQNDPDLLKAGVIIFDEFHERSLQADLGLALCLDLMTCLREDLRILIMSATLGADSLSRFLHNAPIIRGSSAAYPVSVSYLERMLEQGELLHGPRLADHIARLTATGIRQALAEQQGDILAFLPGSGEIRRTHALLTEQCRERQVSIYPLFGDMPQAAQDRALLPCPQGRRRVVLATSIAETSLTLEGIETVIDSGWSRIPAFDPNSGLTRLQTVRVTRAAADQRCGRAGRLAPGHCYRLWNKAVDHNLAPFTPPEILLADLAPLALDLALWGVAEPAKLTWLDMPPAGAFAQATHLLQELEALDAQGRITEIGRQMAALPLHPRLAHMLIAAQTFGVEAQACDLAALLSERDILPGGFTKEKGADVDERLRMLSLYRERGAAAVKAMGANPGLCAQVVRTSGELQRVVRSRKALAGGQRGMSVAVLASLAYPDRIARRRDSRSVRYLLANGRSARLHESDPLRNFEFLAVMQLDAGRSEGRIYLASPLDLRDITQFHARRLCHGEQVVWNEREQTVSARRVTTLAKLTVAEQPLANPAQELVTAALIEGIRQAGVAALPWNDATLQLRERISCLREWRPDQSWPDMSDMSLCETLEDWLLPYLGKCKTLEQVGRLHLQDILLSLLSWPQQKMLEEGAPTHIVVPSGSKLRLSYASGEPPTLAVRLQEMFGLAETPRVCWGKVSCRIHLLSPARRPIQITQDLQGFWNSTYHQVKKELQGRYPKHLWPDNPWEALPTARIKRKQG